MGVIVVVVGWLAAQTLQGPCPGCSEARLRGPTTDKTLTHTATNKF
jgi:hypothetical protein